MSAAIRGGRNQKRRGNGQPIVAAFVYVKPTAAGSGAEQDCFGSGRPFLPTEER
jgi:hypothetical protein